MVADIQLDQIAFEGDMRKLSVPPHLWKGLVNHVFHNLPVGSFLTACLENNLLGATSHGDPESLAGLKPVMQLLYNYAPPGCWGSKEKRLAWQAKGGLSGNVDA